ncbi:FAD binding domain-containing protein [Synergistes jonesii]|uniref:FAD binding domain-containing protein n=1 Tax=Synergistes jonesii TaxID=2754 RepID=UPI00243151E4|nr:FAD binding domain-containing protein [Synergistes jonesii]
MLILTNFAYYQPTTTADVLPLIKDGNIIIAGGSDLIPQLKCASIPAPEGLVDLSGVEELQKIEEKNDGIHIGAMTTLAHAAKNETISEKLPAVAQAARNVAAPQIRNRGTIGGNVLQSRRCFYYNQTKEWRQGIPRCYKVGGDRCLQIQNSPICRAIYYSDMAPALLAYNAQAVVNIDGKDQTLSCKDLIEAHCQDHDEKKMLIKEFLFSKNSLSGVFSSFVKYSLRGSIDFPVINFAYVCGPDTLRIFVGGIATQVIELADTEAYLKEHGKGFTESTALEIALSEMNKKNQVIRESGISVQVKRGTFRYIETILADIKRHI